MAKLSMLCMLAVLAVASSKDCGSKEECDAAAAAVDVEPQDLEHVSLLQARRGKTDSDEEQLQQKQNALKAELEAVEASILEMENASILEMQNVENGDLKEYWKCYNYVNGQNDNWCMSAGGPYVYTHGNNYNYPGCGSCWCCERVQSPTPSPYNNDLKCSSGWPSNSNSWDTKRKRCEDGNYLHDSYQYVYNEGRNTYHSKCGNGCWCCTKPKPEDLKCSSGWPSNSNSWDTKRKRCEDGNYLHNGYQYVYNEGRNTYHSKCGDGCWCCEKPGRR